MDYNQLFVIFLIVVFIVISIGLIFIYYLSRKKVFLTYKNETIDNVKQKILKTLKEKNYKIKVKKNKIHIEKGHFKAINLYLKQKENEVKIYKELSESTFGAIIIIIGIIFFLIIGLVLWQISEVKSKALSREIELIFKDTKIDDD